MGNAQASLRESRNFVPYGFGSPRTVLGTQMVLNKYLVSGTMPGTAVIRRL
jgi:hypothetical protein